MDYTPRIETRTTEQLIEIIANKHAWKDDVILRAEIELQKRGVPLSIGEKRRNTRINYEKRVEKIKSEATYSTNEKLLIVLIGPILFALLTDLMPFHAGQGFKRMNRQAIVYQLVGLAFWGLVIYLYINITS
jgi:hypothetical protein